MPSSEGSPAHEIGLALSGGGMRAIVFHLGVLRALRGAGLLSRISAISTVSGGSVIGALYALYGRDFPAFEARTRALIADGLEGAMAWDLLWGQHWYPAPRCLRLLSPGYSRSTLLGDILDAKWFAGTKLTELPTHPNFIFNATELNSRKAFKFGRDVMGSYRTGPIATSGVSLGAAVAASAAYPIFLPAMPFSLPNGSALLTDGGVYDNLGVHSLLPEKDPTLSILASPCESIIVSDASKPYLPPEASRPFLHQRLRRAVETSMERVRSLTYQQLFGFLASKKLRTLLTVKMDSQHVEMTTGFDPDHLEQVLRYPTRFKGCPMETARLIEDVGYERTLRLVDAYGKGLVRRSTNS